MTKCAYCGNDVTPNDKAILYCKGGCYRTLFLCTCGSANRTTALYCRSCGKEISYSDAENRLIKSLRISDLSFEKPLFELPFAQFGISQVEDLPRIYFSHGFMFLLLKTGEIIILNCGNGEIQANIELTGGELSVLPIEISDKKSKSLFAFTACEIHKIDLIRDFSHELILSVSQNSVKVAHQPLYIDRNFFLSLWDGKKTQLYIVSLAGEHKDLLSVEGRISQPVRVKSKIFFYTQDEVFVYNHTDRNLSFRDSNRHGFRIDVEPKGDDSRAYVLADEERLYRINLDGDVPESLGLPLPQLMQVSFEVSNGLILIAHSGGVLVTNVLGQTEWSSDELYNIYPAYKFPPIVYGNYIGFVMSYPNTEALQVVNSSTYKQAGSCLGNFVLRPAFYAGHLYAVVEEGEDIIMRAYLL
ncbi:MAG: C2H2-type protein [Candidatus Poribacteria bacterium]|nr:C2H2-type protein [Candidatus Poribacteria bacterium]